MNYIQAPSHGLPSFPEWKAPHLVGLSTPSLTSSALARAHETLLDGISTRSRNVTEQAANLAAFVKAINDVDSTNTFGGF